MKLNLEKKLDKIRDLYPAITEMSHKFSSGTRGSVLLVCPYEFVGRSQGGAIRTNNIVDTILLDYDVVTVSYCWTKDSEGAQWVGDHWFHVNLYHDGPIGGWQDSSDFHFYNWNTPAMNFLVEKLILTIKFDVLWVEYSYMAYLACFAKKYNLKFVLSLHNIESRLISEISMQTGDLVVKGYGNGAVIKQIEDSYISAAQRILCTTGIDANYCSLISRNSRVLIAPNIVRFGAKPSSIGGGNNGRVRLVFVGDCNYYPNINGLEWFSEILHSLNCEALDFNLEIDIIGKGSEKLHSLYSDFPFVKIHGFVADLDMIMNDADAVLVPLLIGGGSRLKVHEALERGKYIVSTLKGSEGIDFDTLTPFCQYFDNPQTFVASLGKMRHLKETSVMSEIIPKYTQWLLTQETIFRKSISAILS